MKIAHNVLLSSPDTQTFMAKAPRVIFRKPPNLKNKLVQPKLPKLHQPVTNGCEPCNKPRCGSCKIMKNSREFKSKVTGLTFPIIGKVNCDSKNEIYQINCKFCDKQYIGQTSNHLRVRITGHRFDIFHKDKEKPLAKHAAEHKKDKIEECYILKGINKVFPCHEENLNRLKLKNLEQAHQLLLKSKYPNGLNLR
ncbi:MAG: hypothetical protein KFE23_01000 [Candidatus Baumannia cicadellinicola]|nr:hypothetical protein [Candidatus Baumannia cicadellinicola]